jgi:hypothetical protein
VDAAARPSRPPRCATGAPLPQHLSLRAACRRCAPARAPPGAPSQPPTPRASLARRRPNYKAAATPWFARSSAPPGAPSVSARSWDPLQPSPPRAVARRDRAARRRAAAAARAAAAGPPCRRVGQPLPPQRGHALQQLLRGGARRGVCVQAESHQVVQLLGVARRGRPGPGDAAAAGVGWAGGGAEKGSVWAAGWGWRGPVGQERAGAGAGRGTRSLTASRAPGSLEDREGQAGAAVEGLLEGRRAVHHMVPWGGRCGGGGGGGGYGDGVLIGGKSGSGLKRVRAGAARAGGAAGGLGSHSVQPRLHTSTRPSMAA